MSDHNADKTLKEVFDLGTANRRKVLGHAFVDNALSKGSTDFSRPAQQFVTCNAWEGIWGRPGLEFKQRSLVVIGICAALGHSKELATHVRGALNNGVTEVEIREAMLHVMGYCGFPVGLEAFRVAEPAVEAWKAEQEQNK